MSFSERNQYVIYRIDRAKESLQAAQVLIENELWNSVINRLYYACFYAVNAILVDNEIEVKTHAGLKNQFSLHFIKTGRFDKRYGELFSDLFDWRHKGDYGDLFDFDKDMVINLLEPVEEFIKVIEKEINF